MVRSSARFALAFGVLACGVACGPSQPGARAIPPAPSVPSAALGKGFYLTQPPSGVVVGGNREHKKVRPKVIADFQGPPATNDWWSSLIWQYDKDEPYSFEMFPHPLALRASAKGLAIGYSDKPAVTGREYMFPYVRDMVVGIDGLVAPHPRALRASAKGLAIGYSDKPAVTGREYMFPYVRDMVVGIDGLVAPDTRVAAYSDWAVTAEWLGDQKRLRATFGHGMPFVYFEKQGGGNAIVHVTSDKSANVSAWFEKEGTLGITVAGHHYGLFAPSQATWSHQSDTFQSTLDGKDYFSVAVLPDNKPETLDLYQRHAFAFVKDTRVSWSYDEKSARLVTQFTATTELKDPKKGLANAPLLALYRHQWLHTTNTLLPLEYASPRGAMKVFEGSTFTTTMSYGGVLPVMPVVDGADKGLLKTYVRQVAWKDDLFPEGMGAHPDKDTYWTGKSMGKLATVLQIADQIDDRDDRDYLVRCLENELQDWFDGQPPKLFYYDKTWATLVGVPASYESDLAINDHHFHYGYFLQAAAAIARYDAAWAKTWA